MYRLSIILFIVHRLKQFIGLILISGLFLVLLFVASLIYYSLYCSYQFRQGLIEAEQRHLWETRVGVHQRVIPILMPVCDRPQYLERVLKGLANVDGINETLIIVSQDCGQTVISTLLRTAPSHLRILILTHTPPYFSLPAVYNNEYATSANVKFLLEFAFEHMLADSAIVLESDLVPSVDFYRYYQWAYRHLFPLSNYKILSVHSFKLTSRNDSNPYQFHALGFDSWGWATTRNRWPWLKQHWTKYHGWDTIVSQTARRDGFHCLIPDLSRVRMIGLKGINVNVKTEADRRQFEDDMYMSDRTIEYEEKKPIIT